MTKFVHIDDEHHDGQPEPDDDGQPKPDDDDQPKPVDDEEPKFDQSKCNDDGDNQSPQTNNVDQTKGDDYNVTNVGDG